jgi:hypothetical protein
LTALVCLAPKKFGAPSFVLRGSTFRGVRRVAFVVLIGVVLAPGAVFRASVSGAQGSNAVSLTEKPSTDGISSLKTAVKSTVEVESARSTTSISVPTAVSTVNTRASGPRTAVVSTLLPAKTVPDIVVRKGVAVLRVERVLAGGAFRFSVPLRTVRPKTLERTARKLANRGIKGAETLRPEVFFGLFTTASPAKKGVDGVVRPLFCKRPVWVVRFPKVPGNRQSGVVIPRNNKTATTLDLSVTTEIVVIIDDATAVEVRRSEYRPELRTPTPTNAVLCPSPEVPTTTKRLPVTTRVRG